jgi:hypothetical protein
MADFIAALEKSTGLVAVGVPTKDDLNKIFTVSKVTPEERSRRSVETRVINRIIDRIAIPGMKEEILRLAPSDDEVREKIDTMSLRKLGLWIHHNGKHLEKEAAAAKKQAEEAKKRAEEEKAIISADSEAESRRLDNMEEIIDDDAAHGKFIRKSKRRNMTISK